MPPRKFDPQYHSNIVRNLRADFKVRYDRECRLSDEEVFDIYEENFGVVVEGKEEDPEAAIYEGLLEADPDVKSASVKIDERLLVHAHPSV